MDFNPFDLFDSLLYHDAGDHSADYSQDQANTIDHHGSDALLFEDHAGAMISNAPSPYEVEGTWHSPPTPLTDHAGHELDGHEAGAGLHIEETDGNVGVHVVAHDLGEYTPGDTPHETHNLPDHPVDHSRETTAIDGSQAETVDHHLHAGDDAGALAEQSRFLESILDRHVSEADVAQSAHETGWYDSHRGTTLQDLDEVFESHGIAVERSFDTSLSDLHDALAGGEKVLVGLMGSPQSSLSSGGEDSYCEHLETGHTSLVTDIP
jgi:hypothetical protein